MLPSRARMLGGSAASRLASAGRARTILPASASAASAAPRRGLSDRPAASAPQPHPQQPPQPPNRGGNGTASGAGGSSFGGLGGGLGGLGGGFRFGQGGRGGPATPEDFFKEGAKLEDLLSLNAHELGFVLQHLPLFRHTSEEAPGLLAGGPTLLHNSSRSAGGVLAPLGGSVGFGPRLHSALMYKARVELALSRYVATPANSSLLRLTEDNDLVRGSRQAFLLLADLFNSFHLVSSRAQLRTLVSPQVYSALEDTWMRLARLGLRFVWRVEVHEVLLAGAHVHDSDAILASGLSGGGKGGGGGGGGIPVPVSPDLPPGVVPPSARRGPPPEKRRGPLDGTPGLGGTHRAVEAAEAELEGRMLFSLFGEDSSSSSDSDAPSAAPDGCVRYADLDIQFAVTEAFELWTTRPDQWPQPQQQTQQQQTQATKQAGQAQQGQQASDQKPGATDADQSSLNSSPEARADVVAQMMSNMSQVQHLASMQPKQNDAANAAPAGEASATAAAAAAKPAAAAASTASSTQSSSSASASSSSSSSSSSLPPSPPTGDELPPLSPLCSLALRSDRGLRFYTPLPPPLPEGKIGLYVPEGEEPSRIMYGHMPVHSGPRVPGVPKARWTIKDILD